MKPIDADALEKDLARRWDTTDCADFADKEVWRALREAPTIDAVPINRCKTCTFWDTDANEPDDLHNGLCTLNKIGTSDYFYCGAWTKDTHDFFNGDRDDWVSVVRCKDCKCWTEWSNGTGSCSRFALDWIGTDADDFCSFGERSK